jgi:hypothetical protein
MEYLVWLSQQGRSLWLWESYWWLRWTRNTMRSLFHLISDPWKLFLKISGKSLIVYQSIFEVYIYRACSNFPDHHTVVVWFHITTLWNWWRHHSTTKRFCGKHQLHSKPKLISLNVSVSQYLNDFINLLKVILKEHRGIYDRCIITIVTRSIDLDYVSLTGEDHKSKLDNFIYLCIYIVQQITLLWKYRGKGKVIHAHVFIQCITRSTPQTYPLSQRKRWEVQSYTSAS